MICVKRKNHTHLRSATIVNLIKSLAFVHPHFETFSQEMIKMIEVQEEATGVLTEQIGKDPARIVTGYWFH